MPVHPLRLLELQRDNDAAHEAQACNERSVTVSAGEMLPLLLDAALTNRAWLDDFADDPLEIPHDFYEVLLAYRRFRREAA